MPELTHPILEFTGPYAFLSNFSFAWVTLNRVSYPTVEHAFQAAKTLDTFDRHRILNAASPGIAKKLGREIKLRPDWNDIRVDVMRALVRQKFADMRMGCMLLATHPVVLEEGNQYGDLFWGVEKETRRGENHLGKILMSVRFELHLREAVF